MRRYDICRAYGTFANQLRRSLPNVEVSILSPDGKIDDLIVQWGPEAQGNFEELEPLPVEALVESPASLALEYDLAFKRVKDGAVQLHEHSSNITTLIERHPAFEDLWRDTDRNVLMIGDQQVIPDYTEMVMANHFQYHFSMARVNHKLVRDVIKALAEKNSRSPMLDWINDQLWDGIPRLDTWLSRLWGVEDDPYTRQVACRWFIAAVARLRNPGCKVDWMFVTTGPQGTGKSSMPMLAFRGNAVNMYGSASDKDIHMKLHSGLCMVIDELDALNKGEITFWKSLITAQEDRFRPPYGSAVRTFPRRSLIYGTSNASSFLAEDRSGYRRYMPVTVPRKLNFDGFKQELPQLWTEAAKRQLDGEPYWEITAHDPHKEDYIVADPVSDQVAQFLVEWCSKGSKFHVEIHGKSQWEFKLLDFARWAGEESKLTSKVWAREVTNHITGYGATKVTNLKTQGGRGFRFSGVKLATLFAKEGANGAHDDP